jgi:hypothetical protein
MGHESCGAVRAAVDALEGRGTEPRFTAVLVASIEPGLKGFPVDLEGAERVQMDVEANVRWSMRQLAALPESQMALKRKRSSLGRAFNTSPMGRSTSSTSNRSRGIAVGPWSPVFYSDNKSITKPRTARRATMSVHFWAAVRTDSGFFSWSGKIVAPVSGSSGESDKLRESAGSQPDSRRANIPQDATGDFP